MNVEEINSLRDQVQDLSARSGNISNNTVTFNNQSIKQTNMTDDDIFWLMSTSVSCVDL